MGELPRSPVLAESLLPPQQLAIHTLQGSPWAHGIIPRAVCEPAGRQADNSLAPGLERSVLHVPLQAPLLLPFLQPPTWPQSPSHLAAVHH